MYVNWLRIEIRMNVAGFFLASIAKDFVRWNLFESKKKKNIFLLCILVVAAGGLCNICSVSSAVVHIYQKLSFSAAKCFSSKMLV